MLIHHLYTTRKAIDYVASSLWYSYFNDFVYKTTKAYVRSQNAFRMVKITTTE